jgi:hypothetical protein
MQNDFGYSMYLLGDRCFPLIRNGEPNFGPGSRSLHTMNQRQPLREEQHA